MTDLGNHPGRLVSYDQRRDAAARRAVQSVDIAAANPTGLDPDQDVICADLGCGEIGDFEFHIFF